MVPFQQEPVDKIPKIIHYCWFGKGDKPKHFYKCFESWRKYMPEYKIMEWNEDNFDVSMIPYTDEAYKAKKYAFVADVARYWALYKYGGIYFDTDVKVLKPFDDLLHNEAFVGFENELYVNPGLTLGSQKGTQLFKQFIDDYVGRHFINSDGTFNTTTVGQYMTEILKKYGFQKNDIKQSIQGLMIYPRTYFCPINGYNYLTYYSKNTYSVHLFASSWTPKFSVFRKIISTFIGLIKILLRRK